MNVESAEKGQTESKPYPFRPRKEERKMIEDLLRGTGLPAGEIIRRACKYALPKFLTGEVPIVSVDKPREEPTEAASAET